MKAPGDEIALVIMRQRIVRSVTYEKIDPEGVDEGLICKQKIVGSIDLARSVKTVDLIQRRLLASCFTGDLGDLIHTGTEKVSCESAGDVEVLANEGEVEGVSFGSNR